MDDESRSRTDTDENEENHDNAYKPSNESKMNEDTAMDIIEFEFQDLQEWMKKSTRVLKKNCFDIIDCLKLKNNTDSDDDY